MATGAKENKPARTFNLTRMKFKRINGEGPVYEAEEQPSTIIRLNRLSDEQKEDSYFWGGYFVAEAAGLFEKMKIDFRGCKTEDDKFMRFYDLYTFVEVPLDDDGKEMPKPGESEPNPT